jgi:CubicO group peptidase (beta-lactamase class C family)
MAALAVLALAAGVAFRPDRAIRTATATIAHDLCSTTFVTGSDPEQAFAEAIAPRLAGGIIAAAMSYTIDRQHGVVDASGPFGTFANRAVVRPGYGCVLVHGDRPVEQVDPVVPRLDAAVLPSIAGDDAVATTSPELNAALDSEFDPASADGRRHTHGVVIMSRGQVVAERYAPGYDPTTSQLGFSMTKSVIATLIGVLVQQGRLRLSDPAPIMAWQSPDDPRRAITIEQLMRMDSGLDLDEDMSGFDLSTQLVYLEDDIAAAAAQAQLKATPGTRWHYSGASTHLLARVLRDTVGGTGTDVQEFARTNLFDPLGMGEVTLEMDATGTPIGAHYMLAAPRDWARLGELYRGDGVVQGTRILPEGWSTLVATPTLDSDYGAGWWTVRGSDDGGRFSRQLKEAGVPADTFYALGNLGQYLAVIPSRELVIVRMGSSTEPQQGMESFSRLVVAATRSIP